MIPRSEAYAAIDTERSYQDVKWGPLFDDNEWSVGDWLIFIERYVDEAKNSIGNDNAALDSVRKVAGLAVACMEHHGAPKRQ